MVKKLLKNMKICFIRKEKYSKILNPNKIF
jgi:hypothetical protein